MKFYMEPRKATAYPQLLSDATVFTLPASVKESDAAEAARLLLAVRKGALPASKAVVKGFPLLRAVECHANNHTFFYHLTPPARELLRKFNLLPWGS